MKNIDKLIENFLDKGKLSLNELGDIKGSLSQLKQQYDDLKKIDFDDIAKKYDINNFIGDDIKLKELKNAYNLKSNIYVDNRSKLKKTDKATFNMVWGEIFNFLKNIYILDVYKHKGNLRLGLERSKRTKSRSLLGVFSALIALIDNYKDLNKLYQQLLSINNFIQKVDTNNEGYETTLRNDLWEIILNINESTNIENILEKTFTSYLEYENSFLDKGFYKEKKSKEGVIHNLPQGELNRQIKDNQKTADEIFHYIKSNIESYVNSVDNIEKYDIISDRDFIYSGNGETKTLIKKGDKIEVKKNKYKETHDSYYSEPLASPVKSTQSEIRIDNILRSKYTNIIGMLYEWLGNEGKSTGESILKKMIKGTKGLFLDNYIFVPIENMEFYLSNKGQSSCPKEDGSGHYRIAIRYRLKPNKPIYELNKDGLFEMISYSEEDEIETKYVNCEGDIPKVIVDGSILLENTDYISEYVDNLLDL